MISLISLGQEHRNELVTPFTNLTASLFEGHRVTKLDQRLLPCARVQVDGVDQGSVDIENGGC